MHVNPWPTDRILKTLVIAVSVVVWLLLALSVVGLLYAMLIALALFFVQLTLISHVRGNGVKISETQFPEIHRMLVELSLKAGLKKAPEAYIMESGGSLNAVSTRWLSSTMIILYSDLVEACRNKPKVLEMILGHELGHIAEGHLKAAWFLMPGLSFPFLGKAYSRACEFTCDRYARELSQDRDATIQGLTLLAVGSAFGSDVNIKAYTEQRRSLESIPMTLGRWMTTHPPLCDRVLALMPELGNISYARANVKTAALLLFLMSLPLGAVLLAQALQ